MMKRFLVTGGNFNNKGAQAMVFVTISELRARFPECSVDVLTNDKIDPKFKFCVVNIDEQEWIIAAGGVRAIFHALQKGNILGCWKQAQEKIRKYDAIIDISGFTLSSQWGMYYSKIYLTHMKAARKNGVPMFLMPQSFGPFNYSKKGILGEIKKELDEAAAVFVREPTGERYLSEIGVINFKSSCDLVLQNKLVDYDKVYDGTISAKPVKIETTNNVAVIPNYHVISISKDAMEIYTAIVRRLIELGKTVYLVSHAREDFAICQKIRNEITVTDRVFIVEDELNCIEYSMLLHSFDYIVASRYHSIVHGYKESVPALILGWAEKYLTLAELLDQKEYVLDMRQPVSAQSVMDSVEKMNRVWKEEKKKIKGILPNIQKNNCYDAISEYFERRAIDR